MRVAAHAFGAGRPARDLLVSPGHALCLDLLGEVLVPAATLVNGTTITREDVDSVTYWHVELDSHDVLLAENTGAESYLDVGNRAFFAQGAVVDFDATPDLMPDAAPDAGGRADFCRPLHGDGPLLDVARAQLRHRAAALGWDAGGGLRPVRRPAPAWWTARASSRSSAGCSALPGAGGGGRGMAGVEDGAPVRLREQHRQPRPRRVRRRADDRRRLRGGPGDRPG